MYTIFAVPQDMKGIHRIRQTNAITSWTRLQPEPEIILFGDDWGIPALAKRIKCRNIQSVERNEYGTPLIADVIMEAQEIATYDTVCLINSDIIVSPNFGYVLLATAKHFPDTPFLMIGRRFDMEISEAVDFDTDRWERDLYLNGQATGGYLRRHGAIDYFGFRKGLFTDIPPFAVGRSAWDNWLVSNAIERRINTVETTEAVTVFHQNTQGPPPGTKVLHTPEQIRNKDMYHRLKGSASGTTEESMWIMNHRMEIRRR